MFLVRSEFIRISIVSLLKIDNSLKKNNFIIIFKLIFKIFLINAQIFFFVIYLSNNTAFTKFFLIQNKNKMKANNNCYKLKELTTFDSVIIQLEWILEKFVFFYLKKC